MIADYFESHDCPVPIQKLSDGYYMFGTKKVYAKIMNGQLVFRVGGGYMAINEFIEAYGQSEYDKIEARRAKGIDPFDESLRSRSASGSPGRY